MVRILWSAAAAATLAWAMAGHGGAGAQELPAVPGTPIIETSDWGPLPKEILWPQDGAVMVLIPAGTYVIGAEPGTDGLMDAPETEVELTSFYIDKFEVSQKQFRAFRKARPGEMMNLEYNSPLENDALPAVALNWFSAKAYADWARKELPSEAMWEVAARGRSANPYTTGAQPDMAAIVVGRGASGRPVPATTETGDVSEFGVVNMAGNVREMTADSYRRDAYAAFSGKNPVTEANTTARVVRGASWLDRAEPLRVNPSRRMSVDAAESREDIGFRTVFVLREAPPETPTPAPSPTPVQVDLFAARDRTISQLVPLFKEGAERVPAGLRTGPATTETGYMANFTPYDLTIAMVNTNGLVPLFGLKIPSFSFATVAIPAGDANSRLYLVAYPVGRTGAEATLLGEISGAPGYISLIMPENFDDVTVLGGEPIPRKTQGEAVGIYELRYSPQWDEVNFHSSLELPIRVTLTPLGDKGEAKGPPTSMTLAPGAVGYAKLTPGKYMADASYLGSDSDPCEAITFTVGPDAARRLVRFDADTERADRIQVFASQVPYFRATERKATLPVALEKELKAREAAAKKASGKK